MMSPEVMARAMVLMVLITLALLGVGIWLAIEADRVEITSPEAVPGTVVSVVNEYEDWRSKSTKTRRHKGRALGRLYSSSGQYMHCGGRTGESSEGFAVRACKTQWRSRKQQVNSWKYPQVRQTVTVQVAGRDGTVAMVAWIPFLPTLGAAVQRPGMMVAGDTVTLHRNPDDPGRLYWSPEEVQAEAKTKKAQLITGAVMCMIAGIGLGRVFLIQ